MGNDAAYAGSLSSWMRTNCAEAATTAAFARTSSSTPTALSSIMRQTMVRIALDAMGGDHAPLAPVTGAVRAARAWGYEILLVGREAEVRPVLQQQGDLTAIEHLLRIVDAPEVIEMTEHPATAVRAKR